MNDTWTECILNRQTRYKPEKNAYDAAMRGLSTCSWIAVALSSSLAHAQYEPIQDRNFTIDLHQSVVLGSVRTVGMAGASTALAEGSSGMLANPASAAVRPATSTDEWDWDWHVDWLAPGLGSDFDNNGLRTDEKMKVTPLLTLGLVIQDRGWAFGISGDLAQRRLALDNGYVEPRFSVGRLVIARAFDAYTIGVGVRTGSFKLEHTQVTTVDDKDTTSTVNLFEIAGAALEAGVIWHPVDRDIRFGASVSWPVVGTDIEIDACDPLDCQGFVLPTAVQVPWRLSVGAAWRLGPTRWNQQVSSRWRDERSLTLAADLVIQGAVENGHSTEGFVLQLLQPSGRSMSTSLRLGAEYEWLPGRLRVRGGTYWEPGRVSGVDGRLHATVGMDVRVYSFCLLGSRFRARLSLTADYARHYGNTGISLGLWN